MMITRRESAGVGTRDRDRRIPPRPASRGQHREAGLTAPLRGGWRVDVVATPECIGGPLELIVVTDCYTYEWLVAQTERAPATGRLLPLLRTLVRARGRPRRLELEAWVGTVPLDCRLWCLRQGIAVQMAPSRDGAPRPRRAPTGRGGHGTGAHR